MVSVEECKKVLEAAMREVEWIIPEDVLSSTLHYLAEYERLKILKSWGDYPETMGR